MGVLLPGRQICWPEGELVSALQHYGDLIGTESTESSRSTVCRRNGRRGAAKSSRAVPIGVRALSVGVGSEARKDLPSAEWPI